MTIEQARRRCIDLLYAPTNQNIINSFKGVKTMTLDDTLVSAAHDLHNIEHLYGNSADLWQKAAKLATIKGKTLTEWP